MTWPAFLIPPNSASLHSVLLPRVIGTGQQQWPATVPQASSQPGSATASLYVSFPFWISLVHSGGSFSVPRETCLLKHFDRLVARPLCVLTPAPCPVSQMSGISFCSSTDVSHGCARKSLAGQSFLHLLGDGPGQLCEGIVARSSIFRGSFQL